MKALTIATLWRSWQTRLAAAKRYRDALRAAEASEQRADGNANKLARAKADLADAQQEIARLRGEAEITEAQIEILEAWRTRELERLHTEAAIYATRRTRATYGTAPKAADDFEGS